MPCLQLLEAPSGTFPDRHLGQSVQTCREPFSPQPLCLSQVPQWVAVLKPDSSQPSSPTPCPSVSGSPLECTSQLSSLPQAPSTSPRIPSPPTLLSISHLQPGRGFSEKTQVSTLSSVSLNSSTGLRPKAKRPLGSYKSRFTTLAWPLTAPFHPRPRPWCHHHRRRPPLQSPGVLTSRPLN